MVAQHKRWALLRLALGFAQVFGASLAFTLIARQGVTKLSLGVVVLTTICTVLSLFLFRFQRRDRR